jgi:YVTN family beta-propeller protein
MIPPSLALSLSGSTLYVADQLNHCIRAVDTTTGAVTDAYGSPGTPGTGDTASGTVTFNTPTGLVLNGTTLFVADYGSNRIRAINTGTSTVTTLVNSGLSGPVSLAVIGANLYEVDYVGCVVNTVPTAGGTLSVLAGTQGSSGNADGDGTAASFNSPTAVVSMGTDLFITDLANNTVRRVNTLSTHTVSTYAGVISDPAYSDSGSGKFNGPTGVVYDNGIVYVADTSNGAVRSINLTTGTVATVLYKGVNPAPANMSPSAIAVDSNHTLYIADDYANAIYTYDGTTLSTVTAAGASFDKPSGMVVDSHGDLYVADANAAKVYKIAGGVATELGALSYHYPCGLALSTDESVLYVADGSGRVIFEQPLTGSVAPTILAGGNDTWTLGYLDGTGAAALFGSVTGMARDAAGNLYVADTSNNVIRQVTPTGIVTTICGAYGSMANVASGSSFALPSTLAHPQAVALVPTLGEGDNMMFIAIGDAIQAISFH